MTDDDCIDSLYMLLFLALPSPLKAHKIHGASSTGSRARPLGYRPRSVAVGYYL